MATQVQNRRGTTAEHSTFTGANGELTVDTTKRTLVVHDGATAGGRPLLREDQSNLPTSAPTTGIYNASGSLAISTGGSGRLFVDASGNVILGTTSILSGAGGRVLQIGATTDTTSTLQFGATTTGNSYIQFGDGGSPESYAGYLQYTHTDNALLFGTNKQERLRITSAGLVGIGTTSPGAKLVVSDTAALVAAFGRTGAPGSQIALSDSISSAGIGCSSGALTFGANGYDTERARIDSSGRLLVGTSTARSNFYNSSSTNRLQVEGVNYEDSGASFTCNSTSASNVPVVSLNKNNNNTVGTNTLVASGNLLGVVSFGGNDGTQFVEAATIIAAVDGTPGADDMPGRLVFSVSQDGSASPTERVRLENNGRTNFFATAAQAVDIRTSSASSNSANLFVGRNAATSTTDGIISVVIRTNGDLANSNNVYGAISDVKLKENIVDAGSQWSDIKALQVRKYNFKEGQAHTQIGLIAQEVELVSPGLVSESPDRDAEGNDLGTVTKSVNYSVLYMKAVKALQEAMERIETLEAKVAALESA